MVYSVNFTRTATYIESVYGTVEAETVEEARNKVLAGEYVEDDIYDLESIETGDVEKVYSVEVSDEEYED